MVLSSKDTSFCPAAAQMQKMTGFGLIWPQHVSSDYCEAFQSHKLLIRNGHQAWNGIPSEACPENTQLSSKLAPKLCDFRANMSSCLAFWSKRGMGIDSISYKPI